MPTIQVEIGKLMAQFSGLSLQIEELKKGMENTNRQLMKLHGEFTSFSSKIGKEMEARFLTRSEIAPLKAVLSVVAVTTLSAICLTVTEMILNRLF